MEIKDIERLAKLARIELTDDEKQTYLKEIGSILGYVDQIKAVVSHVGEKRDTPILRNVFREDEESYNSDMVATDIITEFPARKDNYLKVKKILEN